MQFKQMQLIKRINAASTLRQINL